MNSKWTCGSARAVGAVAAAMLGLSASASWGQTANTMQFNPYTTSTSSSSSTATSTSYSGSTTPSGDTQAASPTGLTPGFWKQDQHFYAWTGYKTTSNYCSIFGVKDTKGLTLLDALGRQGGGKEALGRHAAAALLNASNPYVHYPYTVSQIISMVQKAYATGNFEDCKNQLATANEKEGVQIPKP